MKNPRLQVMKFSTQSIALINLKHNNSFNLFGQVAENIHHKYPRPWPEGEAISKPIQTAGAAEKNSVFFMGYNFKNLLHEI